jgi:hypothetical protein
MTIHLSSNNNNNNRLSSFYQKHKDKLMIVGLAISGGSLIAIVSVGVAAIITSLFPSLLD